MTNLLAIETAFLNLPQVKEALNLQEIRTIPRAMDNGHKKKFDQSLQLSKLVLAADVWFNSSEGKALCNEEGISWTVDEFAQKVFGREKSSYSKLRKAAKLEAAIVDTFKTKCDELETQGKKTARSIEALLKFAKALENSNENSGQGEGGEENDGGESIELETRTQNVFTLTYKALTGNVAVRIDENGELKTTNTKEQIIEALSFLNSALTNLNNN